MLSGFFSYLCATIISLAFHVKANALSALIKKLKVGLSTSKKFVFIYFNQIPFKIMCFLFHAKSSFCSWEIYNFFLTFWL